MHEPCQNETSHYSRENRYFYLSVAPWSRTKIYKLQVQKEKPAVFASHPHTVCPARRSRGNACCVAFSLTSGTAVEQNDYRQTPTLPTARWLRKQEGEEMDVAQTPRKMVSDGTRVGGVCRTTRRNASYGPCHPTISSLYRGAGYVEQISWSPCSALLYLSSQPASRCVEPIVCLLTCGPTCQ